MENSKCLANIINMVHHPKQRILRQSHNIISICDNTVTQNLRCTQTLKPKRAIRLPAYIFDPNQPNLQDKQITDKYVEKLRINSKCIVKPPSIRKSELGQNQLVFTHEEQLKLEVIDEFLERGLDLPEDPFNVQLFPNVGEPYNYNKNNKNSNREYDVHNENNQQTENMFTEELKYFNEWAQNGNKESIIEQDKISGENKVHIQNLNLKALQKQNRKQKRKKQVKVLNFYKNSKFSLNKLKKKQQARLSIEVDQQKVKIPPQLISQFETQKYIEMVNEKLFPTIDNQKQKNKYNHFNKKEFERIYRKQKLSQLTAYTNTKYSKLKNSGYMTQERIQALYDCEMIKGAKQVMSNKQYINLRIMVGMSSSAEDKRPEHNYFEGQPFIKRKQKEKEMSRVNEQIQKILQKNKQRLKVEKQRVIERLRC